MRARNSPRRWSVPLCLGITASIVSRASSFSAADEARRSAPFSASKYCGTGGWPACARSPARVPSRRGARDPSTYRQEDSASPSR